MHVPPALRAAVRTGVPAFVLASVLYAGFRRVGPVPALGTFLDPFHGVWAVATEPALPPDHLVLPALADSVVVVFDRRAVPHVFARNVDDAARALGYLHARFRLFQLELQTRATAGTLSEWFGAEALEYDREQRSLGLAWSAEKDVAALDAASPMGRLVRAYAEGINARIEELTPRDLPLEYRLIGTRPAPWQPVNTFYLVRRMGYTLTYQRDERARERLAEWVGPEAAAALMPVNNPIQEPVVPSSNTPRVEAIRLPPPAGAAGQGGSGAVTGALRSGAEQGWTAALPRRGEGTGRTAPLPLPGSGGVQASNNWVVAPWRTAEGYALLAGDPHLDLSLPSVWYEVHLVVPDTLDVYGVSFPGAPLVLIGFNRDVAWSFTNTGADVLDLYREELDDYARPSRYRLDGAWRPLDSRIEEYRGPTGRVLATDTVFSTHRGPVLREDGRALSLRWTLLEGPDGNIAFWNAGRARSVVEWLDAMAAFRVPTQTGVVADRAGDIAVLAAGRYPVRPGGGHGLVIRDGTTSASDWQGDLPATRFPYARNPAQGFLASANQQPLDPRMDPVYLGGPWPSPWRALRINALLRADSTVTVDEMRGFQTDPGSARADWFVPAFLEAAARVATAGGETADLRTAAALLRQWDRRYTRENERAVLFEAAMEALNGALWDELAAPGDSGGEPRMTPASAITAALLADSVSAWWDDRRTDSVETRDVVLAASLVAGYRAARAAHGDPAAGGWRWDRIRRQNIPHLLRLRPLSALNIPVQGGPGLLNPSDGSGIHGASWRMVVQLGREVRGWGVYPGGQSGNPLSPWYADRLPAWTEGRLDSLPFPRTPDDLPPERRAGVTRLTGRAP
jgi:penicillin amidase